MFAAKWEEWDSVRTRMSLPEDLPVLPYSRGTINGDREWFSSYLICSAPKTTGPALLVQARRHLK
jgi:hypothetical protein